MITSIDNVYIEELEEKFPELKEFNHQYILYRNETKSFLPRYFFEQFPFEKYEIFKANVCGLSKIIFTL